MFHLPLRVATTVVELHFSTKIDIRANAPTNTRTATTETAGAHTQKEKVDEEVVENWYTHPDTPWDTSIATFIYHKIYPCKKNHT